MDAVLAEATRRRPVGVARRPDRGRPHGGLTDRPRRLREAAPQLRRPRTPYDYAGQDPINNYDLSGLKVGGPAGPGCAYYQCGIDKPAVEDCGTECVVVGVVALVGPGKALKTAREARVAARVADRFFARHTGWLNSNDYVRLGWSWKGTAQGGKRVFRFVVGNRRAVVRFLGKEFKIHWHIP
jgi:hypothetical protein